MKAIIELLQKQGLASEDAKSIMAAHRVAVKKAYAEALADIREEIDNRLRELGVES